MGGADLVCNRPSSAKYSETEASYLSARLIRAILVVVIVIMAVTVTVIVVIVIAAVIALMIVIPFMVMFDAAVITFPIAVIEALSIVTRADPTCTFIGWPAPIAFMPAIVA